jgi:hypothetical protein
MASPFSMQNLLASLPGSTSTPDLSNPMSLVSSNPQIDRQQLATGVQDIKDSKNQKLSLMLYALGGALKGDKDFVQNTLALQQMQEGKKKQEEQKKAYQDLLKGMEGNYDPRMIDFAKFLGPEKGSELLMSTFAAPKRPTSYQEYALTDSTPTEQEYLQFLERKARAGATQISTGDKEWSKLGAKKYEERYDAATSAANSNVNLDNLENILNQGLETGFGSEVGLTLNRIGQLMLGSEYKAGDIASAESFAAGATQLILPEVKKLGVNPTDKDLDFVVKGSPELTKSVEGNKLMLKALKLSNERAIDQHNFDNEFYTENPNATEIQRNAAFASHKIQNPQIYTAQSLKEEYNNLLEREAAKKLQSGQVTTTSTEELPLELQ